MSRAALAGSAAPVMARPMTRISAPAAMAAAGRGDPFLVLHRRVSRTDAGNDSEEIVSQIVTDTREIMRAADHAVEAGAIGQVGQRPDMALGIARGLESCRPDIVVREAGEDRHCDELALSGHRVGGGLHHVEPARRMDIDDGRPRIEPQQGAQALRPRYWECHAA